MSDDEPMTMKDRLIFVVVLLGMFLLYIVPFAGFVGVGVWLLATKRIAFGVAWFLGAGEIAMWAVFMLLSGIYTAGKVMITGKD